MIETTPIEEESKRLKLIAYLYDSVEPEEWDLRDPNKGDSFENGYIASQKHDEKEYTFEIYQESAVDANARQQPPAMILRVDVEGKSQEKLNVLSYRSDKDSPEYDAEEALLISIPSRLFADEVEINEDIREDYETTLFELVDATLVPADISRILSLAGRRD